MTDSDIPKMNPEVKVLWLEALPEYEQGTGQLKSVASDGTVTHCCLGVLCELAVKAGVIKKVPMPPPTRFPQHVDSRVGTYLPRKVALWAGIPDISHKRTEVGGSIQADLAEANDEGDFFCPNDCEHDSCEVAPEERGPFAKVIEIIKEKL